MTLIKFSAIVQNKMEGVNSKIDVQEKDIRVSRKPRIILAASGSVAAIKFGILAHSLCDWAEVKAVATKSALHFIDKTSVPSGVKLYTDEDEWSSWKRIGDTVLHIELRQWADGMIIAPLSANTLAKIAGGLCDNLLTCIVRAWDFKKPLFVAPAMNTFMWNSTFTQRHLDSLNGLTISVIPPVTKKLACGDYGDGAMAETSVIDTKLSHIIRGALHSAIVIKDPDRFMMKSMPGR